MNYTEFENFIEQATGYLKAKNEEAKRYFGIGDYSRYEYDLFSGEIWWSEPDDPKVRAKLIIVGSISTKSNTWLWSWANPHFENVELGGIEQLKEFGEKESISKLTEEKWKADDIDGWEMTSVSARLLESDGGYCSPDENGGLYLLFNELEFIPEDQKEKYRPLKKPEQMEEAKRLGDKTKKPFHRKGKDVKDLARGYGACFASDRILVDGCPVGFMYREEPEFEEDGGWRFLAGDETDDYMDDQWNSGLYDVNTIANYDPEIIQFLDAEVGSEFQMTDEGFQKVK